MAYDFSKQKVSVKELDKKRSDAVSASRSSGGSSSIPAPTITTPSTSSDTWNKDVVTLEEAKQQTRDVERGVIDVDKGTTSAEPARTEKISLTQAAAQTQTEKRITAAEQAQTPFDVKGTITTTGTYDPTTGQYTETRQTETEKTYSNLSPIKAGSNIRSAAQLDPVTKTERQTDTTTYNIKQSQLYKDLNAHRLSPAVLQVQEQAPITVSEEQEYRLDRIRAALNAPNVSSGSSIGASSSYTPEETKTALQFTTPQQLISEGYRYGSDPENNTAPVKMYSPEDYRTYKIYDKGSSLAEDLRARGNDLVDDVVDVGAAVQQYNPLRTISEPVIKVTGLNRDTSKQFTKGLAVNTPTGLMHGASAVPLAAEVFYREPRTVPAALLAGSAAIAGGTVKAFKEDPVTTTGELAGALILAKGAGKTIDKVGDRVRTIGKSPVPVESLAQKRIITGEAKFPTVQKGTRVETILEKFKETTEHHPEPTALEKLGGEYGVHVSPGTIPKETTVLKGSSETPGLYVGPDASLHFSGIRGAKYKLLGFSKDSEPAINFVQMNKIERLPGDLRANRPAANKFMLEDAQKGTGYTSVKMEQGVKVQATEPELIIPPGTQLVKNADLSGYYTTWKGRRLPVNVFENLDKMAKEQAPLKSGLKQTDRHFKPYNSKYSELGERTLLTESDILSAASLRGSLKASKSSPSSLSRSRPVSPSSSISSTSRSYRSYIPGSSRVSRTGSSGKYTGSSQYSSGGSQVYSGGGSTHITPPPIRPPKPVETLSIAPRRPVPARKAGKTKVQLGTIKNVFKDPMKALSKKRKS